MVTISPETSPTGSAQERTGWPSSSTVQAPQAAMPQPNFGPVLPARSRNAHNSGIAGIGVDLDWISVYGQAHGDTLVLSSIAIRRRCDGSRTPPCEHLDKFRYFVNTSIRT